MVKTYAPQYIDDAERPARMNEDPAGDFVHLLDYQRLESALIEIADLTHEIWTSRHCHRALEDL
jgi:hypothetical protein